jgi:hypothetical protein
MCKIISSLSSWQNLPVYIWEGITEKKNVFSKLRIEFKPVRHCWQRCQTQFIPLLWLFMVLLFYYAGSQFPWEYMLSKSFSSGLTPMTGLCWYHLLASLSLQALQYTWQAWDLGSTRPRFQTTTLSKYLGYVYFFLLELSRHIYNLIDNFSCS